MTGSSNNNRLLRSFFKSYIAALLIPIAFCYIVYAQSYNIIREQILQSNTAIISNTARLLNEHYLNISDIAAQASGNDTLKSSVINSGSLSSADKYNIKNVLATYKSTSRIISDIYIYYFDADIVISDFGPMTKQLAYDTFHRADGYSFDEWTEQMLRRNMQEMITLEVKDAGNMPAFVKTLPTKEALSLATMVIIINPDAMMSSVAENSYFADMELLVYDTGNNLLMSTGSLSPPTSEELAALAEGERVRLYKSDGGRYAMVYTRPKSSIFKYVTLIPQSIFWSKLVSLRYMLICASILVLLTAVWLAWYLSKKNYSPVKKLLNTLQKTSNLEYNPSKNEYHYIAESIEKVLNSSDLYKKQLQKQANIISTQYLQRFLSGQITDLDELRENPEPIPYDGDTSCRLLLIQTLGYEKLFEGDKINDAKTRQETLLFIISNVFGELFEAHKPMIFPMDTDLFACIVSADGDSISEDALREMYELLKSDLALLCITYVSDIYCFADISEAYYRTLFAASSDKSKSQPVVTVSGSDSADISYGLSVELEQKIINYIRSGDADNAKAAIAALWSSAGELPPDVCRLLKYDTASMLAKASPAGGAAFINNVLRRINAAKTPAQISAVSVAIADELCAAVTKDKMQLSPTTQNIMNYISENFANPALDVTHIGSHFCITPHYISRQFREQTGIFLKDYINNVRIDAAKPLLTDTAAPIADIALQVGYIDSNAFIRVFKKSQGLTPGKFRELYKKR